MIAIIGGTGMAEILNEGRERIIYTKYGKAKILEDDNVIILLRHGLKHNIPPHRINYKANIYALKLLGVDKILAINSVGSLKKEIKPGTFFIPNDFMEFTKRRDDTFYNDRVVHVDLTEPYCPAMRKELKKILDKFNFEYKEGVYICTEGPRFETKSEIKFYSNLGDVVGMTGYPEVVLARELGLCYSSLCNVTNYACGISEDLLSVEEVFETIKKMEEKIVKVVREFINSNFESCKCREAYERGIIC
ncbi:MTAP family purine nucleoside phosphorylase [Methanocaldococcus infernus]